MSRSPQTPKQSSVHQQWWIHQNGSAIGPLGQGEIIARLRTGQIGSDMLACGVGQSEWRPLHQFPEFQGESHGNTPPPPPPPLPPSLGVPNAGLGEDPFQEFVERKQKSPIQQAISYRWEAVLCLILYFPTVFLPLTPYAGFWTTLGWVLNILLYSQARRMQAILNRPIAGVLMLQIMLWVMSVIIVVACFVGMAVLIAGYVRGPTR